MYTSVLKMGLLLGSIATYTSIYTIHITTIDGQDKSMADFQGKKILIVVLPVTKTANDSAFLKTVDSVSRNYSNQISIIGVPSVEDGYKNTDLNSLKQYYRSILSDKVTLTEGMYTRKEPGAMQHELFSWLTHKEKNIHFDDNVTGAGQKFFISEDGELFGVSGPEGRLTRRLMDRIVQRH